jgi:hypothetical protein
MASVSSATRRLVSLAPSSAIWLLHRLGIHFGSGIIGLIINATIGAIVLLLACGSPARADGAVASRSAETGR